MKRLFCGITVFAMVFATCMTGYAQTTTNTVTNCDPCSKCDLWHIPGNGCTTLAQGQQATLNIFDWDATYGYCEQGTNYPGPLGTNNVAIRNCRLVFDICQCPDACNLAEGWVLGVQMEILTPGVYFADDPNVPAFNGATPLPFDNMNMAGNSCYSPNTYQLRFRRINKAQATVPCTQTSFLDTGRTAYDTMKVSYYQNTAQANAGNEITWAQGGPGSLGERLAKVIRTPSPYDGWELNLDDVQGQKCNFWYDVPAMVASGTITSGQHVELRVSLLATEPMADAIDSAQRRDFIRPLNATLSDPPARSQEIASAAGDEAWLVGAPPFITQGDYWENDCTTTPTLCATPGFNYDRDALSLNDGDADDDVMSGTTLAAGGCQWQWDQKFCPDCSSPCSCVIDLGILCCEAAEGDFCLTFPYVIQQAADDDGNGTPDWVTGIALSRLCDPAVNITPTVTLTLTDCDGTEFTTTLTDFGQCLNNPGMTVDQMVSEYGWTPTAGQAWLQVESNFPLGGYQFNMYSAYGSLFGAGVLPAGCNACQL